MIGLAFAPPTTNVEMVSTTATYLTCTDGITAPAGTGQVMTGSKNTSSNGTTYQFQASKTGYYLFAKIKDTNGGNIQQGDTLTVQSPTITVCGTSYNIRAMATPAVTISGDTVRIDYSDCVLPLNGTSASFQIVFIQ